MSLRTRVIPCLDVRDGRVVKGVNFVNLTDEGDPVELAARYAAEGADEICYLDISASPEGRGTLLDVVRRTASEVFVPLTVGGGVRTPDDMKSVLRAGADKVESPYEMGGQKMAQTIMRPTVVTFMELAMKEGVDWTMEEIAVGPASPLQGVLLADSGIRQKLNLILVAIKRDNGEMLFNPSHETPILAGDTLIALGLRKNLDALEKLLK